MENVQDLLVDQCLQYPIRCAAVFSVGLYFITPYKYEKGTEGKVWALKCLGAFCAMALILTWLIPPLKLTADRIIFRPTPSCSTFNNPTRYLAFILDENNNQVFYVTKERRVVATDPHMKKATSFYIISSWIRSPDHYRITAEKIMFQPATTDDVKKPSYELRRGYCVRAAGPTTTDPLHVAFYSFDGHRTILSDTGYIYKKDLEEFHSGWFLVSDCKTDIGRLLFDCKTGFVSSAYVRFTEYTRLFLREETTVAEQVKVSGPSQLPSPQSQSQPSPQSPSPPSDVEKDKDARASESTVTQGKDTTRESSETINSNEL